MTPEPAAAPAPRVTEAVSEWEAEGGQQPPPDEVGAPMLQRLGAALLLEWPQLPTTLQRAIYERAVAGDEGGQLKAEVARFLHDHHGPPPA